MDAVEKARETTTRFFEMLAWCKMELSGFIDTVGEDMANKVIHYMRIGYEKCEQDGCDATTNDWLQCGECQKIKCKACGDWENSQCDICFKWFCSQCEELLHMSCCGTRICPSCWDEYNRVEFWWLDCCREYVCCGREIWDTEDGYYCGDHFNVPERVLTHTDETIVDRIKAKKHRRSLQREAEHRRLMSQFRLREALLGDEIESKENTE